MCLTKSLIVTFLTLCSLSATTSANTIRFLNNGKRDRTVGFRSGMNQTQIPSVNVGSFRELVVTFPYGWDGNFRSFFPGSDPDPNAVLGEVRFNGKLNITYFTVSLVHNHWDNNGVHAVRPENSNFPIAGCNSFPCEYGVVSNETHAHVKTTNEHTLISWLGPNAAGD